LALLSVLPSKRRVSPPPHSPSGPWRSERVSPALDDRLKSGLLGVAAALAVAIPTVLFSVYVKKSYSVGLFLGTPFTVGSISGHVFNYRHSADRGADARGGAHQPHAGRRRPAAVRAEGAFCLALALPLAIPVGIVGGIFGRAIRAAQRRAGRADRPGGPRRPLLVLVEPHVAPAVYEGRDRWWR